MQHTKKEHKICAPSSYSILSYLIHHSYCHDKCFVVPPRAMKGVSPEDFVNDHLTDNTEEKVLGNYMVLACWLIIGL